MNVSYTLSYYTDDLIKRLRPRIEPSLDSIFNTLKISSPCATVGSLEFEEKIKYAIKQLRKKGCSSYEAKHRIATVPLSQK